MKGKGRARASSRRGTGSHSPWAVFIKLLLGAGAQPEPGLGLCFLDADCIQSSDPRTPRTPTRVLPHALHMCSFLGLFWLPAVFQSLASWGDLSQQSRASPVPGLCVFPCGPHFLSPCPSLNRSLPQQVPALCPFCLPSPSGGPGAELGPGAASTLAGLPPSQAARGCPGGSSLQGQLLSSLPHPCPSPILEWKKRRQEVLGSGPEPTPGCQAGPCCFSQVTNRNVIISGHGSATPQRVPACWASRPRLLG